MYASLSKQDSATNIAWIGKYLFKKKKNKTKEFQITSEN